MSSSKRSEMPPPYNEATNQNDQLMLTYENQNNQYPGGNQFSSPGGGPYPVSQHQSQCTPQDQVMRPLVKQPGANVITRDPNTINWMVPAVLACLCCFWPAGIVAIHYASKANEAAANGDVVEAEKQSRKAGYCVAVSFVIGIVLTTLVIVQYKYCSYC
uniref:Proline-rich transmembrane protein 1 n=2 Tax=Magallana gigas TaxID=29159 RepID=A0A8W8JIM7_MAGGI|nr:proline-rich transmembrane protein 1-like isoform X3 [Crassostrea gigas]